MKIELLICKAPFLIDERVFPPLGLITVGTALRQAGHEVSVCHEPGDAKHFGVGPTTAEYPDALLKLRDIKARKDGSWVTIGGPHAQTNPEECLADGFDVVVHGDGENVTWTTFNASGIQHVGTQPLDHYPVADRTLVDIHSYKYQIAGREATTIMTSRGCPYRCAFCCKMDTLVRYYSPERVDREIAYLSRLGYQAVMIFDDTFILNKDRVLAICKSLKAHGMVWRCFVRGDLVLRHGQSLVDTMVDSGCVEAALGIESGSEEILKNVRKGETVAHMRQAVTMLHETGVRVKGFFIVGLPGENNESVEETRRFIHEVPLDAADFTVYQPYRGTAIWDSPDEYDITWDAIGTPDQRFYKGRSGSYQCNVRTSALGPEAIVQARDSLERDFQDVRRSHLDR